MATVNQATSNPSNKLSAATVAAALVSVAALVIKNMAPAWYDPEVMAALTPILIFAVGYMVKDNANIVVKVDQ